MFDATQQKTKRVELVFTQSERDAMAAAAAFLGIPLATWARMRLREAARAEVAIIPPTE